MNIAPLLITYHTSGAKGSTDFIKSPTTVNRGGRKENRVNYHERKANGLCVSCGKPNEGKYVLCEPCREKRKAYVNDTRKWYQQNGICPRCGKEKLHGDEKNCLECAAKSYVRIVPNRDRDHYNETHREWSRRTHHEFVAKGICTRCWKRKSDHGFKTCGICRTRDTEKRRLRQPVKPPKSERAEMGLCYFCCEPVKPGYKTCQRCCDRNADNSRKMDRSNHQWRMMIPRDKRKERAG